MSLHREKAVLEKRDNSKYRDWVIAAAEKVVVIDTDLGLRNLDVVMGLENRIVYNLVDVIEGGCRLKQALIKDKRFSGTVSAAVGTDKG